jgi:hypothetical protein
VRKTPGGSIGVHGAAAGRAKRPNHRPREILPSVNEVKDSAPLTPAAARAIATGPTQENVRSRRSAPGRAVSLRGSVSGAAVIPASRSIQVQNPA